MDEDRCKHTYKQCTKYDSYMLRIISMATVQNIEVKSGEVKTVVLFVFKLNRTVPVSLNTVYD